MIGCLLELKPLEKIKTLLIALLSLTLSLPSPDVCWVYFVSIC